MPVAATAAEHTVPGLVAAIERAVAGSPAGRAGE
jgi:hypothetical protein